MSPSSEVLGIGVLVPNVLNKNLAIRAFISVCPTVKDLPVCGCDCVDILPLAGEPAKLHQLQAEPKFSRELPNGREASAIRLAQYILNLKCTRRLAFKLKVVKVHCDTCDCRHGFHHLQTCCPSEMDAKTVSFPRRGSSHKPTTKDAFWSMPRTAKSDYNWAAMLTLLSLASPAQ